MNLYIAVLESDKRPGRRIRMVVHADTKEEAEAMARCRLTKWTLVTLSFRPGRACILFQDEFPEPPGGGA